MAHPNPREIAQKFAQAQDRLVLQASDLSLQTVASMVQSGSMDLQPQYQRRARWTPEKKSALIESFLLNVPVPPVYLSEEDYGTYAIIDGKQRISAVSQFMSNSLRLRSLDTFTEIEGLTFIELPDELRNALTVRPYIRAVTLLKQSDPQLKYEVFSRLNTGGIALNAQEIRNVAYRGSLNDAIVSAAESDSFLRQQLKIKGETSSAYREMADAEYVLRFLTLADRWEEFTGDLKESMNEFMDSYRSLDGDELHSLITTFDRASRSCELLWGRDAYHRPAPSGWRDQALAGMFDSEMIAVNLLSDSQISTLSDMRDSVLSATRSLFEDAEFDSSVRSGTNTPSRLKYRIEKMYMALQSLSTS
jgi:hypothetical protein